MKTKPKQKSLGQVAFAAMNYLVPRDEIFPMCKSDWHRVARAVVRAANPKPHLNSAAKLKHN